MMTKDAEQAIRLGYSYIEKINDIPDDSINDNLTGNEQVAQQMIKTLKLALQKFDEADTLSPDLILDDNKSTKEGRAIAYCSIGMAQLELGLKSEAINNLKKGVDVVDNDEVNATYHYNLSYLYADSDNDEELYHLKKAVELAPNNIEFRKTLNRLEDISTVTKKGGCFIATAVYNSYEAPEVLVLRKFRDDVLIPSFIGQIFVKLYYTFSPPMAEFISSKTKLKVVIREKILSPFVKLIERKFNNNIE